MGSKRADIVVEEAIVIDIKASILLESEHFDHIRNYLVACRLNTGILLNFGAKNLEFHRIAIDEENKASTNISSQIIRF